MIEPGQRMAAPLSGIRVLELGQIISGTFAGMLMADLGADVIKVEAPRGELGRNPGIATVNGESAVFLAFNRGKRSVALDLKKPGGLEVFHDLVRASDVVVDNFRPGVLERMGLDYDQLSNVNPALVCCSITGFGTTEPRRDMPSFDLIHQAISGMLSVTGPKDGPPARLGIPLADLAAPLFALHGIMAALLARQWTGRGRKVEISMLESMTFLHTYDALMYLNGGAQPRAWGTEHAHLVPWQAFETRDGYVVVATREERLWRNFCAAIDLPELADAPAYATNADRVAHREDLIPILEGRMRARSNAEWLTVLADHEVPAAPVNDLAHALSEPTLVENEAIVRVPYEPIGEVAMLANPLRISGASAEYTSPPLLGQHSAEVLAEVAGYNSDRIGRLVADGTIAGRPVRSTAGSI
jgi:crotonobetainyl-CoA:carnitine CoA-transferase CaiB-like acyl-CoA transferase